MPSVQYFSINCNPNSSESCPGVQERITYQISWPPSFPCHSFQRSKMLKMFLCRNNNIKYKVPELGEVAPGTRFLTPQTDGLMKQGSSGGKIIHQAIRKLINVSLLYFMASLYHALPICYVFSLEPKTRPFVYYPEYHPPG